MGHLGNDSFCPIDYDYNPPKTSYSVPEQWHSQPSYLRVVCAGAGAGGLCVAYKMKKMNFDNYDLVCYDK